MPGVVKDYVDGVKAVQSAGNGRKWEMDAYRAYQTEAHESGLRGTDATRYAVEKTVRDIRDERAQDRELNERDERRRYGYQDSMQALSQRLERVASKERKQAIRTIAIDHSEAIRLNEGDRGRGMERLEHRDIETGRRQAIRDWSHQMNREYKTMSQEQEQKKPAAELSNGEIVKEIRESHAQFRHLSEQYHKAQPQQRQEIRTEMEPIVARERELRSEYTGRRSIDIAQQQDRVSDGIAYGR